MVVDGKHIAEELLGTLLAQRPAVPSIRLGVLMSGGDAAVASFVRIKKRVAARLAVEVYCEELSDEHTTQDALLALQKLIAQTHGVIVQLPLPPHIATETILAALPAEKDVDGIGTEGARQVLSPVPAAMEEILNREQISLPDKQILVVGHGRLVGAPVQQWLKQRGITPMTANTSEAVAQQAPLADIIILGAGSPGLLIPSMIKEGVIILDAGASEMQGKVVGDADPACAAKAVLFTPVPGGIGPIAVVELFKNLFSLAGNTLLPSL